ncbi:MAG TPA: HTTM domain-containing protein [Polyangiaceae bacterium]|nr:HTTM domain-containing protein [Polyangiaceae bacterium]
MFSRRRGWRERLRRAREWFGPAYMEMDPRTLGLYRIVLGILLCVDGIRHWVEAERYYSNAGVLTNHFQLFRPSSEFHFSLFHSFSTPAEVHIAFALSVACYFLFLIGWHTRVFTVLATLWVTSMDSRLVLVENGGYVVVNLMCFWAMFLPVGKCFSVDSLLASLRNQRERTAEELAHPLDQRERIAPHRSLASLALFINFAIIYIFNVVNKYGQTWRDGLTIHYVLHIDRMVTGLAVWVREVFPMRALWAVNHSVLMVEAMIIVLVLWPRSRLYTRPLAMVLITGLHVSFGLMMRLGPFSWFMIGWSTALLRPVHWRALELWYQRKTEPVVVRYRPDHGLAFQLCRLLKRLDGASLLSFESAPEQKAWLTANGKDVWVAARADALDRFLGLRGAVAHAPPAQLSEPSPARLSLRKWTRRLRETVIVYLLLCAASQLVNENKSLPPPFKHQQPKLVRATLQYPRIFQGWGMFAPNPIREDGIVAVDARTVDGRRIDPFSGTEPDLNLSDARGLGLNQIHQDYFNRIRLDHNRPFRKPLGEWLQRYHRETGRAEDEIVAYDIWWLRDKNPLPGELEPTKHEKICIASWRKPRFRPPVGQPPLGVPCRVESAEKEKKEDEKVENER